MKTIGLVTSDSTISYAPVQIIKNMEEYVREEALVIVISGDKKYLGVLRNLRINDPLLTHRQRSSLIDNPELARVSSEVVFENAYVKILGEIENKVLKPASTPPKPRSRVEFIESPSEIEIDIPSGLVIGKHKYSGLEIPLLPEALRYHIGVIGATGVGKSRLVLNIIKEVLEKTNWNILVFDHSGMDYAVYLNNNVVEGYRVIISDPILLSEHIVNRINLNDQQDYISLSLLTYIVSKTKGIKASSINLEEVAKAISETVSYEEVFRKIKWVFNEYLDTLSYVMRTMKAWDSTIMKYRVKLNLHCRKFFESLNEKKISMSDIVDKLLRERLVVIDLSTVSMNEKKYLVSGVLNKLWDIVDSERKPLNTLVVIDEAHNYACQYECRETIDIIERTSREGRKWGLGLILSSQRIIDFSTNVRNNINTFFFSRLQTPGDLQNLQSILDLGGIEYDKLSLLSTREFFFAGLGNPLKYPVLIQVREIGE